MQRAGGWTKCRSSTSSFNSAWTLFYCFCHPLHEILHISKSLFHWTERTGQQCRMSGMCSEVWYLRLVWNYAFSGFPSENIWFKSNFGPHDDCLWKHSESDKWILRQVEGGGYDVSLYLFLFDFQFWDVQVVGVLDCWKQVLGSFSNLINSLEWVTVTKSSHCLIFHLGQHLYRTAMWSPGIAVLVVLPASWVTVRLPVTSNGAGLPVPSFSETKPVQTARKVPQWETFTNLQCVGNVSQLEHWIVL